MRVFASLLLSILFGYVTFYVPILSFRPTNGRHSHKLRSPYVRHPNAPTSSRPHSQTSLNMVFDFLRKRSEEGLDQLANLAQKTAEGKLGEALKDTADYIQLRQRIDAENLKRLTEGLTQSRERLLGGISSSFSNADDSIEQRLFKIEEVLLQADIGATATNTILKDLRTYSKTNNLVEEDILPVLRERLIEALTPSDDMKDIRFSNTSDPTVLFVIGKDSYRHCSAIIHNDHDNYTNTASPLLSLSIHIFLTFHLHLLPSLYPCCNHHYHLYRC